VPITADDAKRINAIRALSIDAVQKANSGHPGLPLGAAPMAYALWTRRLRFNAADPHWSNRDRFVLSAGHGSMLLYSLIYLTGMGLTLDDLENFRQFGSKTPGHPEVHHTPGVEVTTGPLGQGVANAVGLAMAEAQLAATYNRGQKIVDHFTYCLAGDGDLMEGVSAEAASLAGHLQLGKLIVLYDDNLISLAAATSVTFTEDTCARFASYGWHVQLVDSLEGEDVDAIDAAVAAAQADPRPSLVAVRTVIGYGSPRAGTFAAHGEPLGVENVKKTKEALGWPVEPAFFVPDDVLAWWREAGRKGASAQAAWQREYDGWKAAEPAKRAER
jgi:transketolase